MNYAIVDRLADGIHDAFVVLASCFWTSTSKDVVILCPVGSGRNVSSTAGRKDFYTSVGFSVISIYLIYRNGIPKNGTDST